MCVKCQHGAVPYDIPRAPQGRAGFFTDWLAVDVSASALQVKAVTQMGRAGLGAVLGAGEDSGSTSLIKADLPEALQEDCASLEDRAAALCLLAS